MRAGPAALPAHGRTPMPLDVRCPHCSATYLLPESLLGPGGARVRCPSCQGSFSVTGAGEVTALPAAPPPAPRAPAPAASAPPAANAADARAREARIARAVLDELNARSGAAIEEAKSRGRLFAECGPMLLEAWDEYRNRVGRGAQPGAFREALQARWGVDLPAGEDR